MQTVEVINADEEIIKTQLSKFNKSDAAIAELRENFMTLTINGIEDKAGYKVVYDARQVVKGNRIDIEKKRKELKATVLEVGRAIDGEAKRLTDQLEPIEDYLLSQQNAIDKAIEDLKVQEEKRKQERTQKRIDALAQYGFAINLNDIQTIPDEMFNDLLSQAKDKFEAKKKEEAEKAEIARQAEIHKEAQRKHEQEILEASRLQQEETRKKLEAQLKSMEEAKAKLEFEAKVLRDQQTKFEADKLAEERKKTDLVKPELAEAVKAGIPEHTFIKEAEILASIDSKPKQVQEQNGAMDTDKHNLNKLLDSLRTIQFPPTQTALGHTVLSEYRVAFNAAAIKLKAQIQKL